MSLKKFISFLILFIFAFSSALLAEIIPYHQIKYGIDNWNQNPTAKQLKELALLIDRDLASQKNKEEQNDLHRLYRQQFSNKLTTFDINYNKKMWRKKLGNWGYLLNNKQRLFSHHSQQIAIEEMCEFVAGLGTGLGLNKKEPVISEADDNFELPVPSVLLDDDEKGTGSEKLDTEQYKKTRSKALRVSRWILGNFIERGIVNNTLFTQMLKAKGLRCLALAGGSGSYLYLSRKVKLAEVEQVSNWLLMSHRKITRKLYRHLKKQTAEKRVALLSQAVKRTYNICQDFQPLSIKSGIACENRVQQAIADSLKSLTEKLAQQPATSGWTETYLVALEGRYLALRERCQTKEDQGLKRLIEVVVPSRIEGELATFQNWYNQRLNKLSDSCPDQG